MYEAWRVDQARNLIVLPVKQIIAPLGPMPVRAETVSRWRQGAWPIPVHQAAQLAEIQQSLLFLRQTLGRHGIMVLLRPRPGVARDPLLVLANFAATSTRVLEMLIQKQKRGERLTAQEAEEMNRLLDESAASIETLREMVKEQTVKRQEPQP